MGEALNFAGFYKLNNLCAIIDVNRLGQSDPAPLQHDMEVYKKRLESFGFHAIVVDGHDIGELCKAFAEAESVLDKPTCLIAKTFKGKYFPNIEDLMNWHGKALGDESAEVVAHVESLMKNPAVKPSSIAPPVLDCPPSDIKGVALSEPPAYQIGQSLATRQAYGAALAKIAKSNSRVVALDGDMKNSTFSQELLKVDPSRYIECFICEQNMLGVGIGVACRDRTVAFASTFAAFLTRGFDNLRMGVISQTNLNVVGSQCGVSIGEDGPSQMAPSSTQATLLPVNEPWSSPPTSEASALSESAGLPPPSSMRTTSGSTSARPRWCSSPTQTRCWWWPRG